MASNTLPITLQVGALPPNVRWTPQQLIDAAFARASLVTSASFALFVAGSTEPSSNVGPWLKDGNTWYVWSDVDGGYVPQTIASSSLGYIISSSAPDPLLYQVWIETAVGGSPLAVKTYFSGAWVDVYAATLASYQTVAAMAAYYTSAQTDAAIAAAVGGISFANYLAQAGLFTPQVIPVDAASHLIVWDTAILNPAPSPLSIATSRYVAPAAGVYSVSFTSQVTNNTGTPASMQAQIQLFKNGIVTDFGATDETPSPSGARWYPKMPIMMIALAVNDYLELWVMLNDGVNTGNCNLEQTYFNVIRVSS